MKLKLTSLLLAICSLSATAQIQFTLEEDYFAGPALNKDKNYTGGFFLSIPHAQSREQKDFAVKHALEWMAPERLKSIQDVTTSFQIGSVGFTPENIGSAEPVLKDRPYSSSLFIGYNQLYKLEKSENLYEYRLDYFGLRIMDRLQTAIHLAMDTTDGRPVPFGWDHQIADYKHTNALGAIMPNFRFTHARFFNQNEDCCFRTYWKAGGSIGTQIYGHGLVGVRIGKSQNGLFSYGNVPISTFTKTRQSDYKDFYLTIEASVNAWGYNGFLQGIRPGGNDSHRLTFEEVTKLTSLLEFGVHRTYKNTYFNYKLSRRSKEFNLDEARPQWWGAVTVGFRFCD